MLLQIIIFIILLLLFIILYKQLSYSEGVKNIFKPKPKPKPTPPMVVPIPTTQIVSPVPNPPQDMDEVPVSINTQSPMMFIDAPIATLPDTSIQLPIAPPQASINQSSLNNSAEIALLMQNNNEIININTNLSTLKERVNNMQQQQKIQQEQSIYKQITDGVQYLASTQPQQSLQVPTPMPMQSPISTPMSSPSIVPIFDGTMNDNPDYKYKECWSYGTVTDGLTYPIVTSGIYPNIKSMPDCVKMAVSNNSDTAAYNGSNLCLVGGGEYKNYTKMACDSDIYGKKAWQVYSKI